MNILFQGDSITDSGRTRPHHTIGEGYVNLIAARLTFDNPNYKIYNRGVSGNRIGDIYARWIEDTLNIDFDVLSILCGINDVGYSLRLNMGADTPKFKFIYDRMIYEAKQKNQGAKFVLLEPFVFKTDYTDPTYGRDVFDNWEEWEYEVLQRATAVKELAQQYGAIFVPLHNDFKALSQKFGAKHFSEDCIHPTPAGHELIARKWIECCKDILF